jgi:hypothetical protein
MAWVAASSHGGDVHSAPPHVVECMLREAGCDTPSLVVGIDSDDFDDAHALVERIESNGDESDRPSIEEGNEGVSILAPTTRRTSSA